MAVVGEDICGKVLPVAATGCPKCGTSFLKEPELVSEDIPEPVSEDIPEPVSEDIPEPGLLNTPISSPNLTAFQVACGYLVLAATIGIVLLLLPADLMAELFGGRGTPPELVKGFGVLGFVAQIVVFGELMRSHSR